MAVTLLTYNTFQTISGKRSTIDEFRQALSKYSRDAILYLCSAIGTILKTWEGGMPDIAAQEVVVRSLFDDVRAARLTADLRNTPPRLVLHRQQLLFVAKEALTVCPVLGLAPFSEKPLKVGDVFLMASDHLLFGLQPKQEDDDATKILCRLAECIPMAEYSFRKKFRNRIAKAFVMMNDLPPKLSNDPDYLNLSQLYEKHLGLSIPLFQSLCFATISKYIEMDVPKYQRNPDQLYLKLDFFRRTAIDEISIKRFRNEISGRPEALKKVAAKRNFGFCDFTLYRDRPLIFDSQELLYCLDVGFLTEKLEMGPFWWIHNYVLRNDKDKEKLHRFWAKLFEEYVNWLILECADKQLNEVIPHPSFEDGATDEAADCLVKSGFDVVIIETKSSTFTAKAKYSGDLKTLSKEIDEKLVETEHARPKGVKQLSRSVEAIFGANPRKVKGIDLQNVSVVYPLLIVRDDIADSPYLNHLLNLRFTVDRKKIKGPSVAPLTCISAECLDQIAPCLAKISLPELLHQRLQKEKPLKMPFCSVETTGLKKSFTENQILDAKFKEFANRLSELLFPGGRERSV
jgi:hypothetical protein